MKPQNNGKWFDNIDQGKNKLQDNLDLLKNRRKFRKKVKINESDKSRVDTVSLCTTDETSKTNKFECSVEKKYFPKEWLCNNNKEKVNSSLAKVVLDWTEDKTESSCIKQYCFWPKIPTFVPTITVISALARYVGNNDTKSISPLFIYPFFPFDISRINYSRLNSCVAHKHITNKFTPSGGVSDIESCLLSFSPMIKDHKDIPLTCADISSINYFDTANKVWSRKRNPFHYVRTEKSLINITKKRIRLIKNQGDFDGIANVYGLPFDWDFDFKAIEKVIKENKENPEIVIDLSMAASRRVNGYMSIVKKIVKGLRKLMHAFNGDISIKILSDNPEAMVAFSKHWQSQNKKNPKHMLNKSLGEIKGFCNKGDNINSRRPFNGNQPPKVNIHIHGNQHYQLCQTMYHKIKEHVGSNLALAPVTSLYKWLLNAGSSIVSDELMAEYLEKNKGKSQTHYIERTNAAPMLINRAAAALHAEGLAVEWEVLLNNIRDFQNTQKNTTDASQYLQSLLNKPKGKSCTPTALLLPKSKLIEFSANYLLKNITVPIEMIKDLNSLSLTNINRIVINGYHYKTVGDLLAIEKHVSSVDWLLSTQEATQLYRLLQAILSINGFSQFHFQAKQLCEKIESKLNQIKSVPSLSPERSWPNESSESIASDYGAFTPVAEINFIDTSTLLVGESSDILRYDSSDSIAVFSRVKPSDLRAGDEILLIDAEMKYFFLDAIPQEYHVQVIGPEGIVMQYRQFARSSLSKNNVFDIESAIKYSREQLAKLYPNSNECITTPMLKYWCDGIFNDDIKAPPKASNNVKYFLDFSEMIGFPRDIAKLLYRDGFCKTRGNHISQGRKENVALSQMLIDKSIGRNYHIPENKIDEIVAQAIKCVNLIDSIKPLSKELEYGYKAS
jgi:hypothetical protein